MVKNSWMGKGKGKRERGEGDREQGENGVVQGVYMSNKKGKWEAGKHANV